MECTVGLCTICNLQENLKPFFGDFRHVGTAARLLLMTMVGSGTLAWDPEALCD